MSLGPMVSPYREGHRLQQAEPSPQAKGPELGLLPGFKEVFDRMNI